MVGAFVSVSRRRLPYWRGTTVWPKERYWSAIHGSRSPYLERPPGRKLEEDQVVPTSAWKKETDLQKPTRSRRMDAERDGWLAYFNLKRMIALVQGRAIKRLVGIVRTKRQAFSSAMLDPENDLVSSDTSTASRVYHTTAP
ncbi:hypothetical protein RhiJN_26939 [Ceratobasidium sp. AG-Ba]|nr:hypothetical protein RhiJN_26939 [Ceratobasidium sp. AG-Ba]